MKARMARLLEHHHVPAALRQEGGYGRACGTAADYQHLAAGLRHRLLAYSLALIPACLITLAQRGISRPMAAASSAGEPPMTSRPRSSSFLRTSGCARIFTVSRCSRSMIAGGVPAGAMSPNHGTASKPG